MMLRPFRDLPPEMQTEALRPYYEILAKKRLALLMKRVFDIALSLALLLLLWPILLVLALLIKIESPGPALFLQERVTRYGRVFRIFKFRTMVQNAQSLGPQLTSVGDSRITKMGRLLRKLRLDELPQLLNVLSGQMSFVGTRPETPKYVRHYTDEMRSTLLLPAGITSLASICFKDEDEMMKGASNIEECYISQILPLKMRYNLQAIRDFSLMSELKVMLWTGLAVLGLKQLEPGATK